MASVSSANCGGENIADEDSKMSEEIIEMYCEDCEKDLGTIITADGFCEKCFEYLCSTCIRYHKKHLPHHSLQDSANMPKDFCFDKCEKHSSEITKFYCNTCEVEACAKCKSENHETCTEVSHIPSLVKSETITNEIRDVRKSIGNALKELAVKKIQATSSLNQAQSNRSEVCDAIKNHKELLQRQVFRQRNQLLTSQDAKENEIKKHHQKRAEIIANLDKEKAELIKRLKDEKEKLRQQLQIKSTDISDKINESAKDLLRKAEEKSKADVHNIKIVLSNIDKTEAEVNEMKKSMELRRKTGQKCGLFVTMKHVKSDMKKLKAEEKKTDRDTEICKYEFEAKPDHVNLVERAENEIAFGHLLDKSLVKRNLIYEGIIYIKPSKKGNIACITGLCTISCGLVVACKDNQCIKLIDVKQKYEKSSMKLDTVPFDVTTVGTNQVASTLPDARKIVLMHITSGDKLVWSDEIDIGKKCYGIDLLKPNLIIVACHDPGSVEILRLNGEPIKTLSCFTAPKYISVDHISGIFYVEDNEYESINQSEKWTIKKVNDLQDIKLTIYSHNSNGVAVDNNGAIYVYQKPLLYRRKGPLHQLSRSLESIQSIDIEKHVSGGGSCLYFCHREFKLYIGTTWGNIVVLKVR